ncbi:MAG: acyl-CoA thioesterase [Parvularculaceae bacterium]|nr:acyl-CoA thioesterase [Parvularculaceae bacterium]
MGTKTVHGRDGFKTRAHLDEPAPAASVAPTMRIKGCLSMETAFVRPITPEQGDFDELGHVNNAVYLRWAQDIAVAHWEAAADAALKKAYLWVVLRHEIDYRDPVLPGDAVLASTWINAQAEGPRFDRHVDIRKTGAARPAARLKSTWVLLDAATRRPRRVGPDILQAFGAAGDEA